MVRDFADGCLRSLPCLEILTTPVAVQRSKLNGELADIGNLLALESVQVGLKSCRCVLEVLGGCLERVFQLRVSRIRDT